MKFRLEKGFGGNIILQEFSVLKAIDNLSDCQIKIYMYLSLICTGKKNIDINQISEKLHVTVEELTDSFIKLESLNLIKFSSNSITLLNEKSESNIIVKPDINPENVQNLSDDEMKDIISAGEKCFKKLLSVKDVDTLVSIKHYYNFDASVMTIMLGYIEKLEKKSMAYIEKMAIDWYDNCIDTPQKAHAYIRELEEKSSNYNKLCTALGIYNRTLTKKEKGFADKWFSAYSLDQIKTAYETTVDTIGKISFAYMDSVLSGKGEKPAVFPKNSVKKIKPSGFNNFKQEPSDFAEIKRKKLESMMNKVRGVNSK